MPKIKLNFSRLSLPEKIARAQQIVDALTGNASFPTPTPPLAGITTAINNLDTAFAAALAARQTAKEKTSDQNVKEDALDKLVSQIAAYVESVAVDDEVMVQSAGMDIKSVGSASSDTPLQPQSLTPSAGDHDGEIDLSWEPVSGAKSYVVERSVDPPTPASYAHDAVVTKSKHTAAGLTSGTRYWFRVAAVNNNGQSGWSDPATKIAP